MRDGIAIAVVWAVMGLAASSAMGQCAANHFDLTGDFDGDVGDATCAIQVVLASVFDGGSAPAACLSALSPTGGDVTCDGVLNVVDVQVLIASVLGFPFPDLDGNANGCPEQCEPPPEGGCPGVGSCAAEQSGPGCSDAACCEFVCLITPSCCEEQWTATCGSVAVGNCDLEPVCGDGVCVPGEVGCPTDCDVEIDGCPGDGGCFGPTGSPGCTDVPCCETICLIDKTCCSENWDALCAALAFEFCGEPAIECPQPGACDAPHFGGGCEDVACCESVCDEDIFCCSTQWDAACVEIAETVCP